MVKNNMRIPGGTHIESGWVDEVRREKNWAQLKHEEKVFGKKEEQKNNDINDWLKGQMGFGT